MKAFLATAGGLAAVLCTAAPAPAHAAQYGRDASAGAVCHPANGAAAGKFTYGNHHIVNIGTTDQYVICDLAADDIGGGVPNTVLHLGISVMSANAGVTVSCVAQTGFMAEGTVTTAASVARSHFFDTPNSSWWLAWDSVLPRQASYDVLTLNCKLPPLTKLGLIERTEVPPA